MMLVTVSEPSLHLNSGGWWCSYSGNALTTTLGSQVAPRATSASSSWDTSPLLLSLTVSGQPQHFPPGLRPGG